MANDLLAFRGSIAHCLRDPGFPPDPDAIESFKDGLLIVEGGKVSQFGPAAELMRKIPPDIGFADYTGHLIVPGFIDCHVHYPQVDVIASYGTQLLEWLETYTYPAEKLFGNYEYAKSRADFFLDELLRNGTTSAMVFATVHPESVDAIFSAANERGMRLYAGKVLMDRNCPAELQDTAECSYRNSKALIEKWHGMNRLGYAITPRFAPTSSEAQLEQAGRLAREHPDVHIHTHVAENLAEVRWVAELFPDARSYLDVYNRFGLVRDLSVFAHGIHLDDTDLRCLARNNAAIAFCPSSNLFIGSGLFDLTRTKSRNVCVGFGTDIGGGTSLNMLQTMADGYKVQQLLGNSLSAYQAFYLATLGGAEALHIEDRIGNFEVGKEADFTVLDCQSTPIIARLSERTIDLSDELFIQMTLGDDRAISATYLMGRLAYEREAHSQLPGILPALTNVT